jgi:hypothetical protein
MNHRALCYVVSAQGRFEAETTCRESETALMIDIEEMDFAVHVGRT